MVKFKIQFGAKFKFKWLKFKFNYAPFTIMPPIPTIKPKISIKSHIWYTVFHTFCISYANFQQELGRYKKGRLVIDQSSINWSGPKSVLIKTIPPSCVISLALGHLPRPWSPSGISMFIFWSLKNIDPTSKLAGLYCRVDLFYIVAHRFSK